MILPMIFIGFTALVCLLAPTALAVWMIRKHGAKLWPFLLGAIVFTVFQLLTRLPLLSWLQGTTWFALLMMTQPVLHILLLAFTAGLFEEIGRFIGIRFLLKPDRITWENAFVFGLGHGGIEALVLVGINYVVLFFQVLGGQHTAELLGTPASYFLVAVLERVLAIIMHIGFTMLVFYAVRQRNVLLLISAIIAHMVVDAAVPLLKTGITLSVWATEGVLAVVAALLTVVTIRFKALLRQQDLNNGGDKI